LSRRAVHCLFRVARAPLALVCALSASLASATALAQENREDALGGRHRKYESPQHFAIELRLSPFYYPDVDSEPDLHGCKPFAGIFGTSPSLLFSGEFDWQAIRIPHLGTLGPGVGAGVVSFSAAAPNAGATSSSGCDGTSSPSGESTTLNIYPFYAVAVLRADALWKELGVPFVPYAKLGPAMAFWQASNTLGTSKDKAGSLGQGFTLGTQLALGVAFNLNVLDEYTARNFDQSMGVNGTYLFVEFTDANLDGLWVQPNALRVGDATWTFGLAWEF
jgi:hypothetical protein